MVIVGSGVDVVEIGRIERALARAGERFAARVFTPAELADCRRHRAPARHFALRFAAKEAAMKALGTGWGGGVGWHDVEVVRDAAGGGPLLRLHGGAAERARASCGLLPRLALGCSRSHALAVVLLEVPAR
jgi:holo-[acyl-carrier protein] synthase